MKISRELAKSETFLSTNVTNLAFLRFVPPYSYMRIQIYKSQIQSYSLVSPFSFNYLKNVFK